MFIYPELYDKEYLFFEFLEENAEICIALQCVK